MGVDWVLHRPILRSGVVVGYLWCTFTSVGFWPRTGADAGEDVAQFWLRWLNTAREQGLSPWATLASWDPRTDFPHGRPAPGAPNELAGREELAALAEGRAPAVPYADDSRVPVRHYQVIRGNTYLGRLWASVDDAAAGFLTALDLPEGDPAAPAWRRRLAESRASGLTPGQALEALREFPDDGTSGHLADPLGQGYLRELRR